MPPLRMLLLSSRVFILLCVLPVLSACGFEPLHKKDSLVDDRLASILIMPIADRRGQILHNMLRNALNPGGMPVDPAYRLTVRVRAANSGVGGTSAAGTASAVVTHTASYELADARNDRVIFKGNADSRIYYAGYNNYYDKQPSLENAEQNGLRTLSREIAQDLASLFARDTD